MIRFLGLGEHKNVLMNKKIKRSYKDTVFTDLFKQETYYLQLLQTLHPELTGISSEDVRLVTLKSVITNHQYNDLSLLVKDQHLILVEAQSTWSVNILIRIFLYLSDTILEYINHKRIDMHNRKRISLPKLEFYVIYTGRETVPETISLRSDFFMDPEYPLDLKVRVITTETDDIIGQYIKFCHVMDDKIEQNGKSQETARQTTRYCIENGILAGYLKEREMEVIDIMIMLFEQDFAEEMYGRAQRDEGIEIGREEERKNTERERQRADAAEQEVLELKRQLALAQNRGNNGN